MARRRYTEAEKAEALKAYAQQGPTAASEATGIPMGTIAAWAVRKGYAKERHENAVGAVNAATTDLAVRRLELAHGLLDDIAHLRAELFAPCVQRIVKTVSAVAGRTEAEIVDVELDQPTFAEQTRIMTSIGIAVDKAQLLSGAATSRTETLTGSDIDAEVTRLARELDLVASGPA